MNSPSDSQLADAAERIRVLLTDALHARGNDAAKLHLLNGSKTAIRNAIESELRKSFPSHEKTR